MFTGLIEATGNVRTLSKQRGSLRIAIKAPEVAKRLKTGDSVAVSGVCLTALAITQSSFEADLAAETVAKTSLSRLKPGAMVNLELPLAAGQALGGHIVQGHVDGVGKLISMRREKNGEDWRLTVSLPKGLSRYVVNKGSITVEGISLTVAQVRDETVEIAIIPHTYAATNLNQLSAGAPLNIEVDVLAKYAEKQAEQKSSNITIERLMREGF